MTTKTKEPETEEYTLEDVAEAEERLREFRQKHADLRGTEAELQEEIAEGIAAGEDVEELRADLREIRDVLEDFDVVDGILVDRIRERRFLAVKALAEERARRNKKSIGGMVGEVSRRIEQSEDLTAKLIRQLEWLERAPDRRKLLVEENRLLADRFGFEAPAVKNFADDPGPEKAVRRLKLKVNESRGLGSRLVMTVRRNRTSGDLAKAARKIASHLRNHFDGEETPTPELLAQVENSETPTAE